MFQTVFYIVYCFIEKMEQEKQKKFIGSSSIGKMIMFQDKDRKYAEVHCVGNIVNNFIINMQAINI